MLRASYRLEEKEFLVVCWDFVQVGGLEHDGNLSFFKNTRSLRDCQAVNDKRFLLVNYLFPQWAKVNRQ
jgi:hypothetical protein